MKPSDYKRMQGSTFFSSVQVNGIVLKCAYSVLCCIILVLFFNRTINHHETVSVGIYRLRLNLSSQDPGCSSKNIQNTRTRNEECWIDLEKNENPLKVHCDMITDGGKLYA